MAECDCFCWIRGKTSGMETENQYGH